MSLDNFYKLRKNFIVLGLTGKMQSGSDSIVKLLSQEKLSEEQKEFFIDFQKIYKGISDSEARKIRRINDFFKYDDNWLQFEVLDYRNVLLLFILHYNYDADPTIFAKNISKWICDLGTYQDFEYPRFGSSNSIAKGSSEFISNDFCSELAVQLSGLNIQLDKSNLNEFLKDCNNNFFFESKFKGFAQFFYKKLDSFSPYLRHRLMHIVAYCLRRFGTLDINVIKEDHKDLGLAHIYIIADAINRLIKIHRSQVEAGEKVAHIIIDRLKNSYESMYFKEKYSGFYMIASNCNEEQRQKKIKDKYDAKYFSSNKEENLKYISSLDEREFKLKEFMQGSFEGFDVENCVQKADYHTYLDSFLDSDSVIEEYNAAVKAFNAKELDKTNKYYIYQPFNIQVLKLIALIQQPGLITPTYIERIMHIAHSAKLNSGCISRQVGAVVTDASFSVKGIGWNDVPQGQVPCANRDLRDLGGLVGDENEGFTQFELGKTQYKYEDGKSFNEKIKADFDRSSNNLDEKLKGRPCPFCFKTFHNKYEDNVNQVHTRSLHAEENAMLQISKYGGQGLNGGNLFTTASPCELCSKKAFQLGIKNIFYIDLYPGISLNHILEGGMNIKKSPKVYQFQGVIGRGYQKLYEPFMTLKDEISLRSDIKPTK